MLRAAALKAPYTGALKGDSPRKDVRTFLIVSAVLGLIAAGIIMSSSRKVSATSSPTSIPTLSVQNLKPPLSQWRRLQLRPYAHCFSHPHPGTPTGLQCDLFDGRASHTCARPSRLALHSPFAKKKAPWNVKAHILLTTFRLSPDRSRVLRCLRGPGHFG